MYLLIPFIVSGPLRAIKVPKKTHIVPSIGAHIALSSTSPKLLAKCIMEFAKRFAVTAYQPKFAKLITVDKSATPFCPRTDRSQIHKSIP